jgi:L-aspartate oxidase
MHAPTCRGYGRQVNARKAACTAPIAWLRTACSNASCSARRRRDILECWDDLDDPPKIREWDESRVTDSDEEVVIKQNWTEIRRFMWNYVGIVRTTKRLERAAHRIKLLEGEIADYYGHFRVTTDLIELRNLQQCADLIVQSALKRHESRGLHYTLDYPETGEVARDTVLVP